jgi:surfeit locus 1 family protein
VGITKLVSHRWWWTTLIVIAGVVVLFRLGFWQLDRLEQRRSFNIMVAERWNYTPFDLNENPLPSVLDDLEYRRIQVRGEFDYNNQILLTQQTRDSIPGVVLVTPYVYGDNQAVLVARGWIPSNQATPEQWSEFEEPAGEPVIGLIQETQLLPSGQPPSVPDAPQVEWFRINIDAIQPQMPYTLLPVFIYQLPEEGRPFSALPFRTEPIVLDEGSHFSYAIQWFMFALILGGGYFFFIQHMETREKRLAAEQNTLDDSAEPDARSQNESLQEIGAEFSGAPPQKGHA